MPKPEYDKEKVLRWYASLKDTLKDGAGIDIDNFKDLARVKVYNFTERKDTKMPGDPSMYDDEKMPAFIPKKFNENKEVDGYVVPKPHMPSKELQDELDDLLKENNNANSAYVNGVALLKIAYDSKKENEIEEAKRNLAEYEANMYATFDTFRKKGNDAFKDYYQWMYANQTKFDPIRDYDQIEELYHCAMEGRLYINPLDSNPEDRWQLVVIGDGSTSAFSKVGAKEKAETVDVTSILRIIDTIKTNGQPSASLKSLYDKIYLLLEVFEQQHGMIGRPDAAKTYEIGNPPAKVAKPGFRSWMKRIFSFGFANGDFKKYDAYKTELAAYNRQKTELREYNKQLYDQALLFANTYHKELGIEGPENVLNPGIVEDNRMRMHNAEFVMGEERPEKEIYNESTNTVMIRHAQIVEDEIFHNHDIINPDGSFNTEKSTEYWTEKKELVLPVVQHDREKAFRGFDESKALYERTAAQKRDSEELNQQIRDVSAAHRNNEIADAQQEVVQKKDAKQQIEKAEDSIDFAETKLLLKGLTKEEAQATVLKWTQLSVDDRLKQIGTLYEAKPEEALITGINVLAICATRNQEYNIDGSERDYSKLKLDKEIFEDINKLLDIAEHPEKKEENKEFLDEIKQLKETTALSPDMFVDSTASLLSSYEAMNGVKEVKELGTGLFMCANLSFRYAASKKNPKGADFSKDFKVSGDKNRTLSDKDQRERLYNFGKECSQISKIVAESKNASKEISNIKESMAKGTYGVQAPDLNIKRDTNLDLAKEPGLYH